LREPVFAYEHLVSEIQGLRIKTLVSWHRFTIVPLWMARDRKDGDNGSLLLSLDFIGAVMPEDSISARSAVLGISLEDLSPLAPDIEVNSWV